MLQKKPNQVGSRRPFKSLGRAGNASLDYVLVLCVVLPLAVVTFRMVPRIIQLFYDMLIVVGNSPIGSFQF